MGDEPSGRTAVHRDVDRSVPVTGGTSGVGWRARGRTRTVGMCVLPAAVLVELLRRGFRRAYCSPLYAAGGDRLVESGRFHQTPTDDFALLYYLGWCCGIVETWPCRPRCPTESRLSDLPS